jgi:hypothetical protein
MLLPLEVTFNVILYFKKHITEIPSAISQALFKILLEGFPVLATSGTAKVSYHILCLTSFTFLGLEVYNLLTRYPTRRPLDITILQNNVYWKGLAHHIHSCSHCVSDCPILLEPYGKGMNSMMDVTVTVRFICPMFSERESTWCGMACFVSGLANFNPKEGHIIH